MKILQIIADGNPGGGTSFVLDLVKNLENPTKILTQKGSYAQEKTNGYGIDFFTSRLDLRIPLKMKRVIDAVQPDLIHVHGGRAAFFLSFCKKRCPIIYTVHGLHALHRGSPLGKWGERKSMKHADLVVFVSHAEEKLALQHNLLRGAHHCTIPHGLKASSLPAKKSKPKLLGFLGRLSPEKDPLFLLDVMNILGPQGYHLKMIGGGELEGAIDSPYITVTGKLPRQKALEALAEVDTLVVPSKWEAFGLVLLEAMAMEIPIVAARLPSFEEITEGGAYITLINRKDPALYAAAVVQGGQDTAGGKKHVLENFSWERMFNSYRAIFRDLNRKACYALE